MWLEYVWFLRSPVGGHWVVSTFGVLRIMLPGMLVYTFLCGQGAFSSPGRLTRSGIAASYRNSLSHLVRNFRLFHSGYTFYFVVMPTPDVGSNVSASSPTLTMCAFVD